MGEKSSSTAEIFLERIELYHELGNQVVSRLLPEQDDPLESLMEPFEVSDLSEETLSEMSMTEYFKYTTSCSSLELREMSDEDINYEVKQGQEKFRGFVQLFTGLYPDHHFSLTLNHDQPVSEIVDSGSIEPLLTMVEEGGLFDARKLMTILNLAYLIETGELDSIKGIPEKDRLIKAHARLDRMLNSRPFISTLIDDHVSDSVFDDMVSDGLIDADHPFSSIDISYSEEQPRQSSLLVIYKAIDQKIDKLELFVNITPRELVSVEGEGLDVARFNRVVMKHLDKSYKVDMESQPFSASPEMESFALSCLLKALDKINKFNTMPEDEMRVLLGM